MTAVSLLIRAKPQGEGDEIIDGECPGGQTAGKDLRSTASPQSVGMRTRLIGTWRQFRADVFGEHTSIRPLAGWLLLALLGLVAYLTVEYAPGAFERATMPHGADPKGVISVETGYWTIGSVALVALLAGFEPRISRAFEDWDWSSARHWLARQPAPLLVTFELAIMLLLWAVRGLWRFPSRFWSFLDYLLARPVAFVAGATQRGTARRYCWGALIVLASVAAGLLAPPPFGLYGVAMGIVMVLAIVRRWIWAEADRERFLIERGEREGAGRIGFKEDLRDEALVAPRFTADPHAAWTVPDPAGYLRNGREQCAFTVDGGVETSRRLLPQLFGWLGYFGAEMGRDQEEGRMILADWLFVLVLGGAWSGMDIKMHHMTEMQCKELAAPIAAGSMSGQTFGGFCISPDGKRWRPQQR